MHTLDAAAGGRNDIVVLRRLLTYLAPHWWLLAASTLALLLSSLTLLVQPYLMMLAIDRHILTGDPDGLGWIAIGYVLSMIAFLILEVVRNYATHLTGQRVLARLRRDLFEKSLDLDVSFHDVTPVGGLMSRLTSDVDVFYELFTVGIIAFVNDALVIVGVGITLLFMNWRLALVVFAITPAAVLLVRWFRARTRVAHPAIRESSGQLHAFLQEHIAGLETIQLMGGHEVRRAQFEALNRKNREVHLAVIRSYAAFYPALPFLTTLAIAVILWYGGLRVVSGGMTLGAMVAFIQYSQRFLDPIEHLAERSSLLQAAVAAAQRVFALIDMHPTIAPGAPSASDVPDAPDAPVAASRATAATSDPPPAIGIEFDGVWFAYKDQDYVLEDVSFRVDAGTTLGVAGATGAGKSTLVNLILRFYDVTKGRILVNGRDVRDYDVRELRRLFGVVLQDTYLFTGTVESNITLGQTDELVRARLAAAPDELDALLARLPGGLAQLVTERGTELSAGEKQLIALIRALASDARCILLDEATSRIDVTLDRLVKARLPRLLAGRTAIVVAHRLDTIQDLDAIVVMHKGRLAERGDHASLVRRKGLYESLRQL
jgi:ATP-binding cassette, subfamily B, multidrug efflux pump